MTTIPLEEIEAAHARIKDHIRRTPFIRARFLKDPPVENEMILKLECLQVTGSFKPRGASNVALDLPDAELQRGLITASGGNHGLGVAYAAHSAGAPAVIYLPVTTPAAKTAKLKAWGAEVVIAGAVWDEANDLAKTRAERDGLTYVHPFADARVAAGQGTLALEMMKQSSHCETFVVAIGGGGLISGIASAIKAKKPSARIIGVEAEGAPTLTRSLAAGEAITLAEIRTEAGTLAPKKSDPFNIDIIRETVEEIVLVSDQEMREAARWLYFEFGVAAELSGAAATAALRAGRIKLAPQEPVGLLVCGAGGDGIQ